MRYRPRQVCLCDPNRLLSSLPRFSAHCHARSLLPTVVNHSTIYDENPDLHHGLLGVFRGIRGQLSSHGRFQGVLGRIGVEGDTDTPDFQVKSSTHAVDLRTRFQALVDAKNGDTQLQEVESHFWNTSVQSRGSVARRTGQKGKEAVIQMASSAGRIQDLLRLFIKSPRAPMYGVVSFRATTTIPPGKTPF